MVCPEFTPDQAKEWVDAGEIPELAKARRVDYVDIDAGHWPMYTKPVELARILADCTGPEPVCGSLTGAPRRGSVAVWAGR